MRTSWLSQSNRRRNTRLVLGWLLWVGLGIGLLWLGFWLDKQYEQPDGASPLTETDVASTPTQYATAAPSATLLPSPTVTSAPIPTDTPVPTPAPPTPTPYIVAGADGVNVRTGPDTSYARLGYLDPDTQAEVIGRDGEWWQIRYNDVQAWIYGPLVTAFNAEHVGLPTPTPAPQVSTPSAEGAGWADEVFQFINQIRDEHGLTPYTRNEVLERAAQLHGQDSAQRGELSHTGSDGSNVTTRVQRAGYEAAGVSEITVTGNSSQWAVDWWMDETPPNDPHRSAILSTWYSEIGVAVVPAGDTHYFIAILGRPK